VPVAISWVVYTKGNLAPDSFTVNGVEYLQGSEQYNEGIKIMENHLNNSYISTSDKVNGCGNEPSVWLVLNQSS
jgi:hypothetical protein